MRWFKISINPILLFGIIIYIMLTGILVRITNDKSSGYGVKVYIPIWLISIFISLYYFYENNRVRKAKREERKDMLNQRRQEILDNVIKSKSKNDPPVMLLCKRFSSIGITW